MIICEVGPDKEDAVIVADLLVCFLSQLWVIVRDFCFGAIIVKVCIEGYLFCKVCYLVIKVQVVFCLQVVLKVCDGFWVGQVQYVFFFGDRDHFVDLVFWCMGQIVFFDAGILVCVFFQNKGVEVGQKVQVICVQVGSYFWKFGIVFFVLGSLIFQVVVCESAMRFIGLVL